MFWVRPLSTILDAINSKAAGQRSGRDGCWNANDAVVTRGARSRGQAATREISWPLIGHKLALKSPVVKNYLKFYKIIYQNTNLNHLKWLLLISEWRVFPASQYIHK